MEMSRGVSAVSLPSTTTMDTTRDTCSCPHQISRCPGEAGRTSFLIWKATDFSVEFSCCTKNPIFKVPSRNLILRLQSALGEFVKLRTCSKRVMVFLLLLLNFLIVGASPIHRVRHRHYRNASLADQLCDSPGEIDRPTHDQCSTMASRVRRDVNKMTLREGQASSLCIYSVCVDEDSARRPVHINRVYCLESGCRCKLEGAYRCTQLSNKVEVWYPSTNTTQMLDVEYGCVCAAKHGSSVRNYEPDTGDK